ncbi:helix-turn-helix domain-containing protein [Streptomyces sp. APSN-46.1]|uniref:helix-turn-helix domain-containing protein n=1 Tax=Streptomyces sp. APSN-46.1 TaxID=2929049 RepID=UPI001FB38C34|nr:helix-turn-helix transcriptional regulator [Streptomyces sp. APSN-46.1]MCJ1678816.1 helix-turn-helix domain-containing protein [Streptomyces sp. APSN-46.1]
MSLEEHSWSVDPEDEQGAAVVAALGRQMRARREALGVKVAELASRIGYGEDLVYKVEAGKRIAKPEYLVAVDEALKAGGLIRAMREDLAGVRYPKKVRQLAKLEAGAIEIGAYRIHGIHGLLQTEEYGRTLFEMRQPAYSKEEVERFVAARLARKSLFDRDPPPALSLVQEEATLRRRIGGTMVWRRQLEHLLELVDLRYLSFQVMPLSCEVHAGMDGGIEVLKFADGSAIGRSEGAFNGRPVSDLKQLRFLELRFGMIRAQALSPQGSRVFIEDLLGE